ncbi:MAG: TPM domain-containing protein [Myxococcota bacterium]|nr:TPM domain-containing protein [Myxococcota bacterium]
MTFGPAFGRKLITASDDATIVAAIGRAEQGSRGEVRIHLERRCADAEPMERARALFGELGMHETEGATGVLLYVALRPRVACVFAGEGIHGAAAEGFWDEVVDRVARGFAEGRAAAGLVEAIDRIGELLRRVAPGEDRAGNELPDQISTS